MAESIDQPLPQSTFVSTLIQLVRPCPNTKAHPAAQYASRHHPDSAVCSGSTDTNPNPTVGTADLD